GLSGVGVRDDGDRGGLPVGEEDHVEQECRVQLEPAQVLVAVRVAKADGSVGIALSHPEKAPAPVRARPQVPEGDRRAPQLISGGGIPDAKETGTMQRESRAVSTDKVSAIRGEADQGVDVFGASGSPRQAPEKRGRGKEGPGREYTSHGR